MKCTTSTERSVCNVFIFCHYIRNHLYCSQIVPCSGSAAEYLWSQPWLYLVHTSKQLHVDTYIHTDRQYWQESNVIIAKFDLVWLSFGTRSKMIMHRSTHQSSIISDKSNNSLTHKAVIISASKISLLVQVFISIQTIVSAMHFAINVCNFTYIYDFYQYQLQPYHLAKLAQTLIEVAMTVAFHIFPTYLLTSAPCVCMYGVFFSGKT